MYWVVWVNGKEQEELKLALFSASLLSAVHHSCVSWMFSNPFLNPSDENKVYITLFTCFFLEQMLYLQCMYISDLFQKARVISLYGLSIFSVRGYMCALISKQLVLEIT